MTCVVDVCFSFSILGLFQVQNISSGETCGEQEIIGLWKNSETHHWSKLNLDLLFKMIVWVVVSDIFYFHPYLGRFPF